MSKKLIALLIVFFITLAGFIYTEFFYPKTPLSPSSKINQQPTPSLPLASLYFVPNLLTTTASSSAQVNVVMQSTTPINLVQLEIGFDPLVLFNVQITPSDYFINPELVLYNIGIKNGRISYGITGEPNPMGGQTIATITFNTYNYELLKKETSLTFLPKTLVRKNGEEIKLNPFQPAKIIY